MSVYGMIGVHVPRDNRIIRLLNSILFVSRLKLTMIKIVNSFIKIVPPVREIGVLLLQVLFDRIIRTHAFLIGWFSCHPSWLSYGVSTSILCLVSLVAFCYLILNFEHNPPMPSLRCLALPYFLSRFTTSLGVRESWSFRYLGRLSFSYGLWTFRNPHMYP